MKLTAKYKLLILQLWALLDKPIQKDALGVFNWRYNPYPGFVYNLIS
ncbi:MAG: hypothetical protein ACK5MV_12980 [Aminipila sp.]